MQRQCTHTIPKMMQFETVAHLGNVSFLLVPATAPMPEEHMTEPTFADATSVTDIRATNVVARLFGWCMVCRHLPGQFWQSAGKMSSNKAPTYRLTLHAIQGAVGEAGARRPQSAYPCLLAGVRPRVLVLACGTTRVRPP